MRTVIGKRSLNVLEKIVTVQAKGGQPVRNLSKQQRSWANAEADKGVTNVWWWKGAEKIGSVCVIPSEQRIENDKRRCGAILTYRYNYCS